MDNFENVNLDGIDGKFFLLGLLSAFDNRYQATADNFFGEISWKQFFAIICVNLHQEPPTLRELADLMGSSHQNVKQILNKLEEKGFVQTVTDPVDKRKQRILLTEKTRLFCEAHDEESTKIIEKMFEGVSVQELAMTIQTITKMENNLKEI